MCVRTPCSFSPSSSSSSSSSSTDYTYTHLLRSVYPRVLTYCFLFACLIVDVHRTATSRALSAIAPVLLQTHTTIPSTTSSTSSPVSSSTSTSTRRTNKRPLARDTGRGRPAGTPTRARSRPRAKGGRRQSHAKHGRDRRRKTGGWAEGDGTSRGASFPAVAVGVATGGAAAGTNEQVVGVEAGVGPGGDGEVGAGGVTEARGPARLWVDGATTRCVTGNTVREMISYLRRTKCTFSLVHSLFRVHASWFSMGTNKGSVHPECFRTNNETVVYAFSTKSRNQQIQ